MICFIILIRYDIVIIYGTLEVFNSLLKSKLPSFYTQKATGLSLPANHDTTVITTFYMRDVQFEICRTISLASVLTVFKNYKKKQ